MMSFDDHIHGICENMMLNAFPIAFERYFTVFRQKRFSLLLRRSENDFFDFKVTYRTSCQKISYTPGVKVQNHNLYWITNS